MNRPTHEEPGRGARTAPTLTRRLRTMVAAACVLAAGFMAAADNNRPALKLLLKDGSSPTYILDGDTKITFEHANMCFSNREYKFEIPLSQIDKWTYEAVPSGVEKVNSDGITLTRNGDTISLSGLAAGTDVAVYNTEGVRIHGSKSTGDRHDISAESWSTGVYVIKAGKSTFKIVKL